MADGDDAVEVAADGDGDGDEVADIVCGGASAAMVIASAGRTRGSAPAPIDAHISSLPISARMSTTIGSSRVPRRRSTTGSR